MYVKTTLRISALCWILLSALVWSVLWVTPEMLPYAEIPEALNAARGWGDINCLLFFCVGIIWFLSSQLGDFQEKRKVSAMNFLMALLFIGAGTFHHTSPGLEGPPPPVFILMSISGLAALYGWRFSKS